MNVNPRREQKRAQRNEARRLSWRAERERATERRRVAGELARYWAEAADVPPFLPRLPARSRQMAALRAQGLSFRAIGIQFGLSRQRVHQLLGTYERWIGARERNRLERWYFLEAGRPYTARMLADLCTQLQPLEAAHRPYA